MSRIKKNTKDNLKFIETARINNDTYDFYVGFFKKIATSLFEWINVPSSMNAEFLEECLFYYGMAGILKTEDYGFINTKCSSNGDINIYGLPTKLNCYSFGFQQERATYMGNVEADEYKECILVKNNIEMLPTFVGLELFCRRL